MRIGIDISQLVYENTGVANYLSHLISALLRVDTENEYVFFASSLRRSFDRLYAEFKNTNPNVKLKQFLLPPILLDFIWNRLHTLPVDRLVGNVDMFISSDWTQPPVKSAVSATVLYDLIVYKYPEEMDKKIVSTQKRRIAWMKKECDLIFCISEATKKDAIELLGIDQARLRVIYPGMTL